MDLDGGVVSRHISMERWAIRHRSSHLRRWCLGGVWSGDDNRAGSSDEATWGRMQGRVARSRDLPGP
jgi:hypothetical protein